MSQDKTSGFGAARGVGVVAAMGLCCAGPVLVAAGALGAIGGFLLNPLVIVAAVGLALAAVVGVGRRRSPDDRCRPPDQDEVGIEGRKPPTDHTAR